MPKPRDVRHARTYDLNNTLLARRQAASQPHSKPYLRLLKLVASTCGMHAFVGPNWQ